MKDFGFGKFTAESIIKDELEWLIRGFLENSHLQAGSRLIGPIDPSIHIIRSVANVIGCIAFGSRLGEDSEFEKVAIGSARKIMEFWKHRGYVHQFSKYEPFILASKV